MSNDPTDTEQLAEALKGHDRAIWNGHVRGWCCSKCGTRSDNGSDLTLHTAAALLASDWLRDHDAEVANQARREALQEAAQQASMNFPGSTTISGVRLRDWLETQADDDRADTPHA